MLHRPSLVALVWLTAVAAPSVAAQAPRRQVPALQRVQEVRSALDTTVVTDTSGVPGLRSRVTPQEPDDRQHIRVGWTVLGAVLGYVAYRSAVDDLNDADFAAPFSVALFVGVGALLGTLVGIIVE